jgi:hypothetical protein
MKPYWKEIFGDIIQLMSFHLDIKNKEDIFTRSA